MSQVLRRVLLVAVAAAFIVGIAASFASASAKPVITWASAAPAEGATLTSNSGTWNFTYNRTPKQTAKGYPLCSLTGPAAFTPISAACIPPTATSGGSASRATYGGLPNGSYTLTVTLRLTDGGTTSAVRHFSVNVESQSELDCEAAGGTFATSPDLSGSSFASVLWVCNGWTWSVSNPTTAQNMISTLAIDCNTDGQPDLETHLLLGSGDSTCGTSQSQFDCQSYGGVFSTVVQYPGLWTCDGWNGTAGADAVAKETQLENDCVGDLGSLATNPAPNTVDGPYDSQCNYGP